jgi:hypothetical protein
VLNHFKKLCPSGVEVPQLVFHESPRMPQRTEYIEMILKTFLLDRLTILWDKQGHRHVAWFFFESIPIINLSLFLSSRPLMTAECHAARLLKFKADRIRELQRQISADTLNISRARRKGAMLESQIAEEIEAMATLHPLQSPADRIFLEITRNRTRHPNGRRYSVETLAWSREIHDISPRACEIVH